MKNCPSKLLILLTVVCLSSAAFCQNKNIIVTAKQNPDHSVEFSYTKELPGSYMLNVDFTTMENSFSNGFHGVVKNSSGRLLKLSPSNTSQYINYRYSISYMRGDPNPKVDSNFVYVLPFKKGSDVKIKETFNLSERYLNSEKRPNWKSFIADRAEPDTVYAMRKGIVIEIIDTFTPDSLEYNYTSSMNRVIVEHDDGTSSHYSGFNKAKILVKVGQVVYPQTQLGVLEIFNKEFYRLYFDVSYLKEVDLKGKIDAPFNEKYKQTHINPYFYNASGPLFLKGNEKYVVDFDDAIFLKEFTNREKKLFQKNPGSFK